MSKSSSLANKVSKEEILEDLREVADQVEGALTQREYKKLGKYSTWHWRGSEKFDNFNSAKEEAGLELIEPGYTSDGTAIVEETMDFENSLSKEDIEDGLINFLNNTDKTITYANLADFLGVTEGGLEKKFQEVSEGVTYFDGLFDLFEEVGYSKEDIYDEWVEVLEEQEIYGWIRYDSLRSLLSRESQFKFLKAGTGTPISGSDFFKYVNQEYDYLYLSMGTKGGNGTRIYIKNDDIDRFKEYKESLPSVDGAEIVFDKCVSYGKSPKGALAAIKYLCSGEDQKEVAGEVGVSAVTLRSTRDFIVTEGLDKKLA